MNPRRRVVPVRQLIYSESATFPDDLDLVADLPMPDGWTPDEERTTFLRGIGMDAKDVADWRRGESPFGPLRIQVYFRRWCGHDLAFELFGDEVSLFPDERYNQVLQAIHTDLLGLEGAPYEHSELRLTAPTEIRMDLGGLSFPTVWGERKRFEDFQYTVAEFLHAVQADWLTLVACRKCGQSEICRFPVEQPERLREEDFCNVALLGLETTVRRGWNRLTKEENFQAVVDALFRATRFLAEARYAVGAFVSDAYQEWLDDWQPDVVLSGPLYLRDELNGLSSALANLKVGRATRAILVEGESEQTFLRALIDRGQLTGAEIVSYRGRGNLKNIKMMVSTYQEKGYRVFLQGDLDGADPKSREKRDFIKAFRKMDVEPFMFRNDFESAFPRGVLVFAAARLAEREMEEVAALADTLDSPGKLLAELQLDGRKTELALLLERAWHHYHEPDARESEVHRWLRSFYGHEEE